MIRSHTPVFSLLTVVIACGTPESQPDVALPPGPARVAELSGPVILFVGTSLTAGYGLDPSDAYPALIQRKIDSAGFHYSVVNAGVSGETSAGALRRTEWLFSQDAPPPSIVVLETGANDGLRGQDPDTLEANMRGILASAAKLRPPPRVILAGMEAPPNLGQTYTASFREAFERAAREGGAVFLPFLLDGVAGVDSLNQPDGIHPTAGGHRLIAETVWGVLEAMLQERR